MRDAYNSPIGSTHRKRAQKIVSIMRKVGVMDGQGGPGFPMQNAPRPLMAPAPRDYSSVMVFPPAPPRQPINPGVMDGQGGPGFGNAGPFGTTPKVNPAQPFSSGFQQPAPSVSPTPPSPAPRVPYDPMSSVGQGGALKPSDSAIFAQNPLSSTPTTPTPSSTISPSGATIPWNSLSTNKTPTGVSLFPGDSQINEFGSNGGGTGDGSGSTDGSGSGDGGPSQYTGLAATTADAVGQNQGAGMFAYTQLLRSLPGMESVPDDKLPYGAALSGQFDALKDSLKKEYDLDRLLESKNAVISRGVTLEGDLVDYVQKRDEFLNQTNDMIEGYKNRMSTMDMSDPINAGQAQSYLDYLYTLRGRQNKRYIDYLDRSVDEYNKQLTAVSGNYDSALQLYRDDLTAKSNLTLQEYQMYFNSLSGMYQEIADAPRKAQELTNLQFTGDKLRAEAAKDIIAAGATGVDWITQKSKYQEYLTVKDADGNDQVVVDNPASFFEKINSSGYDYVGGQNNLADTLYLDIKKKNLAGDHAGAISAANKYIKMMMDYKGGSVSETDRAYADTVIENLSQGLGNAVYSYAADPQRLVAVQNAAKSLSKGSAWFSYQPLSREAFISSFQNTLDKDLLNDMYDIFDASTRRGNDPKQVFPSDPQELLNQLSGDIGGMKASVALTGSGF